MALPGNPFQGKLSSKVPDIARREQKTFKPMQPWEDPKPPQSKAPITEAPPAEVPATEATKTKKTNKISTSKIKPPRTEAPQSKAPITEAPPTEATKIKSFFRLNLAEAYQHLQSLGPFEFKLFMFLSLRAWGWDAENKRNGTGVARSSIPFAVKGSGLTKSTVERSFTILEEKGLVKKLVTSFKAGNLYEVSSILLSPYLAEPPHTEAPIIEAPHTEATSRLTEKRQPPQREVAAASHRGGNIDSRYLEDKSLSLYLSNFLNKLLKSERESLENWIKDNPEVRPDYFLAVISDVYKNMVDTEGKPIKSPVKYIVSSFPGHLKHVQDKRRHQEEESKLYLPEPPKPLTGDSDITKWVKNPEALEIGKTIDRELGETMSANERTSEI